MASVKHPGRHNVIPSRVTAHSKPATPEKAAAPISDPAAKADSNEAT